MAASRDCIQGPLREEEYNLTVTDLKRHNTWNLDGLSVVLPPEVQQIIRDATIPDTANAKDRVVWGLSPNGVFTTASAYRFLISKSDTPEVKKEFTSIWRAHIPSKIKHFLWLLLHKRIKTNHRLHSLGMNVNPS